MSTLKQWIITVTLAGLIAAVGAIVLVARDDGNPSVGIPANTAPLQANGDLQAQPLDVSQNGVEQSPLQTQIQTTVPTAVFEPTVAPPTTKIHVVASGEFLASIAGIYGVTVEEIIAANTLVNPDRIDVGQELIIPNQ